MSDPRLAIKGGDPIRTHPWPRWPIWEERDREALGAVLDRGEWGGFDPAVTQFEQAFAQRHQARHCVTTVNGTTSLEAALRCLEIGPGDEVIVPPYTFVATAAAVRVVGATPLFADIDPDTYNLSADAVAQAIGPRTRAVIVVHFGGQPGDMDGLLSICESNELFLIEDAAHAHGADWRGRPVGALGDVGSFSFQTSKNLSAGEGGALLTNQDDLADRLWSFANCGRRKSDDIWYEHPYLGSNLRLSGWQASILLGGLERLDEQNERRMSSARKLIQMLEEIDGLDPLRWDERVERHAFHLFIMRYVPSRWGGLTREEFVEALQAEGIPASAGYRSPLYRQPPLAEPHSRVTDCPAAEQACREAIWLPQSLLLANPDEMEDVISAILKVRENIKALL